MKLELEVHGNSTREQNVADARDLLAWLKASRIQSVNDLSLKEIPPQPGEMGPTVLAILGAILGAEATVELVKQVFSWLEAKNKKIEISVTRGGEQVTVKSDNLTPEELGRVANTLGLGSG